MSSLPPEVAPPPAPAVNDSISPPGPPSPAVLIFPPPQPENGTPREVGLSTPGTSNRTTLVALGVGIGIGGAIVLVCVGIFFIWYKKRKRRHGLDGFGYDPSQGSKEVTMEAMLLVIMAVVC